ncbi:MAG: PfkB family carbohydrate kinase [Armatimonadetes bacterium]|nr:PfkB family carbohydrate kinase [Armatimonadota bacterium]
MHRPNRFEGDKELKQAYIVGFGIACIDYIFVAPQAKPGGFELIEDYKVEGGGLTGTAIVAASRLGAQTKLLGRIGDDDVGDQIVEGLKREGVDTSLLIRVPGAKSYFSIIHVDADTAERTIYGRKEVNIDCSTNLIPLNALEGADAVLLDPHWPEGARAVAKRAIDLGIPIVLDMIIRPEVIDILAMSDYPIITRKSALNFAGTNDYSAAIAAIRSLGPKAAVITCGDEGAYYADENEEGHVEAFKVNAVDTTGAGDVFHGAFAFGLTQGWKVRDVVTFASAVAAIKCTKVGGRSGIPTFDQTIEFMQEHGGTLSSFMIKNRSMEVS